MIAKLKYDQNELRSGVALGTQSLEDCINVIQRTKVVSNRRSIWEPKPKIGFQHNTYSLQQTTHTHTEDPFWVSGEA